MQNSFDPDQAQPVVGPDMGPNCLQKQSAEDKNHHYRGKSSNYISHYIYSVKSKRPDQGPNCLQKVNSTVADPEGVQGFTRTPPPPLRAPVFKYPMKMT